MTTENSEAIESAFSQLQTHIKFLSDPAGYVDDKYLIPWVEGALGNKSAGQLFLIFDKAYKDEFGSKSVFISGRVREGFLTQIGNKLADMLVDAVLAGLDSAPAAKRLEQYCRHVEFSSGSLGKNSNVIADIRGRLDTALKKKPDQLEIVRAKSSTTKNSTVEQILREILGVESQVKAAARKEAADLIQELAGEAHSANDHFSDLQHLVSEEAGTSIGPEYDRLLESYVEDALKAVDRTTISKVRDRIADHFSDSPIGKTVERVARSIIGFANRWSMGNEARFLA